MGEGRRGEPRCGEPSDEPQATPRLTVAQAAVRLGITEGAVRSRIKRGTLPTVKEAGSVYVVWSGGTSEANQSTNNAEPSDQSELVESLQDQVAFLRAELERRGEEADRYQRIVAGLAQTNANLSERVRALEPPRDEPQAPERGSESPEGVDTPDRGEGSQEGVERRSWWRRWFGG